MLTETLIALFAAGNNYALELMIVLALIWAGALAYVVVRKLSRVVMARAEAGAEPCRSLAEAGTEW
jgi:hypothetical protein